MEVIVPQNEGDSGSRKSRDTAQDKPVSERKSDAGTRSSNERYLLQAGSFRRNEDADRRRAELILKGSTPPSSPWIWKAATAGTG